MGVSVRGRCGEETDRTGRWDRNLDSFFAEGVRVRFGLAIRVSFFAT